MKMPAFFIGHGSPMNIIEDSAFTKALSNLSGSIPKPKAILVVSAHWLTRGTFATAMEHPKTIYDFYGFPEELYTLKYPAPGNPDLASEICGMLSRFGASCDLSWGLDHASWSILKRIYPKADIPVVQLSLDYAPGSGQIKPIEYHYELACELKSLRSQGILIIGSGNIVHNLQIADFENRDAAPYGWAEEFDNLVARKILSNDVDSLIHPEENLEGFAMAAPTWDHYLPLVYALALRDGSQEKVSFPFEGFQNASISMRAVRFG